MKSTYWGSSGLSASIVTGLCAAAAVAVAQTAAKPTAQTTLGDFAIHSYDRIQTRFGADGIVATLTGPRLHLVSPQYDMSAPHIHVELHKGGIPARYKATLADATGGVRIVSRDAVAHRTTTLTCDHAEYHATASPTDRGHIDLSGHVRSETVDPAFAAPVVQQSDHGTVTFIDAQTTEVALDNGDITGTAIEPAPKKKPGK